MHRRYVSALSAFAGAVLASPSAEAQSQWDAPQHLGCVVNSPFFEAGPALSRDGLSLFFGSMRPDGGAFGGFDLWVSQRNSVNDPWGAPVNLGGVLNTPAIENIPVLSHDQHWLYFNSDRAETIGGVDIWASYRPDIRDDFGWQTPINLGPTINTAGFDAGPTLLEAGGRTVLYFNRGATPTATIDIYKSEMQSDGTFGPAVLVSELNSTSNEQRPSVRRNGREIFFWSDRPGGLGNVDVWTSTRQNRSDPWDTPVNLGAPVNTASFDGQAHIAPDSVSLYFVSNRPGFCGATPNVDIYVTTRIETDDAGEDDDDDGGHVPDR